MTRIISMTIFLGILALILAVAHYYCYNRLSFYFGLSGKARIAARIGMVFLWVCTVTSLPLIRMLPLEFSKILAWLVFPWMGVLLLLFMSLLIADLMAGTVFLSFNQSLQDQGRRTFVKQIIGFAVLGTVGALSALSLKNAMLPARIKQLAVSLKRLPEAFSGFNIVQLTDLHIGPIIDGNWLNHIVERTNALNPDLICITGDLVDGSVEELSPQVKVLGSLRAKHGVYFVTGNHEYYSGVGAWTAYLETLGIKVLRNERVVITIGEQAIDLAGVDDFDSDRFPGHGHDLPKALAGRDPERIVVLMAHQPAAVIEAAAMGVDLQLSGHTHGGQIRPFDYAVKLRQPYVEGLHQHPGSDTQIYVSSGTGFWGPPMRLGTASEITSIKLYKAT